MVTSHRVAGARARVADSLRQAQARYIDRCVPKLNDGQRRYIAQQLTRDHALFDAAIRQYGGPVVDAWLKEREAAWHNNQTNQAG